MIVTKETIGAYFIGLSAAWTGARAGLLRREQDWKKIAMVMPSTTAENLYGWLNAWPAVRKWVGERHLRSLEADGYRLKNEKFEASIAFNVDQMSDDQAGMYSTVVKDGWTDAVANFNDQMVFGLLNDGITGLCFDGTPFFNANHPQTTSDGQTILQSNLIAGANPPWYLLDVRDSMKPLIVQDRKAFEFQSDESQVFKTGEVACGVDGRKGFGYGFWQRGLRSGAVLDQAGFEAALLQMKLLKEVNGLPLGIKPNLLVVGPTLRAAAFRLVGSMKLTDQTDNPNYKAVEVLEVPWLP
jgi:phage major head subunit gpT-like protein